MSLEHCHGSGDGFVLCEKQKTPFSTPIKHLPMSARSLKSTLIHSKSKKKGEGLATHPNITHRRALTLAEFNPSRTINTCRRELKLSTSLTKLESNQTSNKVAGRRIYQLLLLNAWRKQRSQIQTLLASKNAVEIQNSKLDIQVEALHRFRNLESQKREDAFANVQIFEQTFKDSLNKNQILINEKLVLENKMSECEQVLSKLQLDTKNSKNELMDKNGILVTKKCQLGVEQNKCKSLAVESNMSVTQASSMETEILQLCDEIENLQKQLLETELKLQDTIFNNNQFESINRELSDKLTDECIKRKTLEEHNADLKTSLTLAQTALSKELNRGLWKNAENLIYTCFKSLKTIAVIMLPALPENVFDSD